MAFGFRWRGAGRPGARGGGWERRGQVCGAGQGRPAGGAREVGGGVRKVAWARPGWWVSAMRRESAEDDGGSAVTRPGPPAGYRPEVGMDGAR